MRQIEIEWVGINKKVTANLVETKNPNLCELLWNNLPYNSIQSHALVSGDHLYHLAPVARLVWEKAMNKEDRTKSPDGTVFLSQLQHMAVKYGVLSEYLPAAAVGQVIPEHIPVLKQVGQECWNAAYRTKQIIEVRVTRKGDQPKSWQLPAPATSPVASVNELIQQIHNETQKIWIDPPQELLDIHAGRIKSRAGSKDQYFTTMLFVNGEERPYGYGALGGLVRSCVDTDISLEHLIAISGNFIKTPAEFLGYCGLDTQWEFAQAILKVQKDMKTKDDFLALYSTMSTYAQALNAWNLHYFPWNHGEDYKYENVSGNAEYVTANGNVAKRPVQRA